MAEDDWLNVNGMVTDAITQTGMAVTAEAPAVAMGNLYQAMSNSMAMMSINGIYAQQQTNILHQTTTIKGLDLLLNGK